MDQLDGNQHVNPMLSGGIYARNMTILILFGTRQHGIDKRRSTLRPDVYLASCVSDIGSIVSRLRH